MQALSAGMPQESKCCTTLTWPYWLALCNSPLPPSIVVLISAPACSNNCTRGRFPFAHAHSHGVLPLQSRTSRSASRLPRNTSTSVLWRERTASCASVDCGSRSSDSQQCRHTVVDPNSPNWRSACTTSDEFLAKLLLRSTRAGSENIPSGVCIILIEIESPFRHQLEDGR